jgi:phage replication-related protein YjqB (UPF0714/DUF867 family)
MISAYEIESAVLAEIGVDPKRTVKEQESVVRETARVAVFDLASGNVKIELIAPHGGNMEQGVTE